MYDDIDSNGQYDDGTDEPYVEYVHDALGRRIEKIDHPGAQPVTTRFYYDGQNVLLETDENTVVQRYYVNGPTYIDERVLLHDVATEAEHYYLLKELYSVAGLANTNGELVEAYAHDAYGKVHIFGFEDLPFDGDGDGDVDLFDFAAFQACFSGAGVPRAEGCEVFDSEPDDDVDLTDLSAFVSALTGPRSLVEADFDGDSDIDLADFAGFQYCFTGAGAGSIGPGCEVFDVGGDLDVDLDDYAQFLPTLTGPGTAGGVIPLAHSQFGNPYHFTGRRLDLIDTGGPEPKQVYDYRARIYGPLHGRFPMRDPLDYVDGMNLYEYAQSQPTVLADPLGLMTVAACQTFWNKVMTAFTSTRNARNTYISWVQYDEAQIKKALKEQMAGKISWAKYVQIRDNAHQNLDFNRPTKARLQKCLEGWFEEAKLANWMVNQGCKCGAARHATISIKHRKPLKEGLDVIQKIPGGPTSQDTVIWIGLNWGAPKAKKGQGLWNMLGGVAKSMLYNSISADCCTTMYEGKQFKRADDLYKKRPTINGLGVNDRFVNIAVEN